MAGEGQRVESSAAQQRREDYRVKTLEFLALRPGLAHHPQDIRRKLNEGREHDFDLDEIAAACEFQVGEGHAKARRHAAGATKFYQITSAGIKAWERGDLEA